MHLLNASTLNSHRSTLRPHPSPLTPEAEATEGIPYHADGYRLVAALQTVLVMVIIGLDLVSL
jgi:hypothetical protein